VVGEDGLVLESKLNPNFKDESIGAITARITRCVKDGMAGIGFGEYEQIFINMKILQLWIMRFNQQTFVLCCSPEANLGALKIRVSELLEHLSKNIS
jgi:predicted regulator of Ras-like GTPase activity (Roadblock/LC7/MglB family)